MSHTSPSPLAAVACAFNPCDYIRPRENFRVFRQHFHGCPLRTGELSFTGVFQLSTDWQVAVDSRYLLWQKEALLNALISQLPHEIRYVAWIDGDLLFANPDWADEAVDQLTRWPVVQLFEHIEYFNAQGRRERRVPGVVAAWKQTGRWLGAPGGAWAARREVWEALQLFPYMIVGGGDSLWAAAITQADYDLPPLSAALAAAVTSWRLRAQQAVQGEVGYVTGTVRHLYHGERPQRQYRRRHQLLVTHAFDPWRDVTHDHQGLLYWRAHNPILRAAVRQYFFSRREDGPLAPSAVGALKAPSRLGLPAIQEDNDVEKRSNLATSR
ncbi:MAG: hypothetical protein KatS3mg114_0277 [Planctomycetaceae bacterium]|nr:MAG: hypothetical protein KatS3mg114_0277 [Planctomycetaceae bacterium]